VRVFDDGEIVSEVIPEVWLLRSYGLHLVNPAKRSARADENDGERERSKKEEHRV
jgi:hypothetical protein